MTGYGNGSSVSGGPAKEDQRTLSADRIRDGHNHEYIVAVSRCRRRIYDHAGGLIAGSGEYNLSPGCGAASLSIFARYIRCFNLPR